MAKVKKSGDVEKSEQGGKITIQQMRELINKKAGNIVAWNLNEENPSDISDFVSFGSHIVDCISIGGRLGSIPVGRVVELAGLESTGKSYLAAQAAREFQKKGYTVVYFDSEMALDASFLEKSGCDTNSIIYIPATSLEFVLETIENILSETTKVFFVLDSFAFCPCATELEGNFDPNSQIGTKARIMARGLSKILQPLSNTQSTFLVVNQLKTNLVIGPMARVAMQTEPYITNGGKSLGYSYSARFWLTRSKAKSAQIRDQFNNIVGCNVKLTMKKSRFGTEGRSCELKILWGADEVRVNDEESWFEILCEAGLIEGAAWRKIMLNGEEIKFRTADWESLLKERPEIATWAKQNVEDLLINKGKQAGEQTDLYSDLHGE